MVPNCKSRRSGRAHRRPDLEALEVRQLLSLTDPIPAASSSASAFVRSDGSIAYDDVIQASVARATYNVDGAGSNVAVIDTGVSYTNPAFGAGTVGRAGDKVVAGVDFTGSPNGVLPTWQHGTGVAGIIDSADASNPGVAPGAGIVALRVFGDDNTGSFDRIAKALDWVVQNHDQYHITAVNLSVADGGNYTANLFATDGAVGQAITTDVEVLDAAKIPVMVAAGNSFDGKTQGEGFAAIIPDTISVTATDETRMTSKGVDPLASNAQRLGTARGGAAATDIAAPGVNLIAPSGSSGTATEEGTSFATPQVTGTVVLLQQMYQRAYGTMPSVAQLDGWLQAGADTIHDGATGIDIGRLNVAHSLRILHSQIQGDAASRAAVIAAQAVPPPAVIAPVAVVAPVVIVPVAVAPVVAPVVTAPTTPTSPPTTTDTSAATETIPATPPPVTKATPVNQPMTEVFVNGESVGTVATTRLSSYSRLFALTKGVARNLRAWTPAGSTIDLGAVKPSGTVVPPRAVAIPTRAKVRPGHHSAPPLVSAAVVEAPKAVHRTRTPGQPTVASV